MWSQFRSGGPINSFNTKEKLRVHQERLNRRAQFAFGATRRGERLHNGVEENAISVVCRATKDALDQPPLLGHCYVTTVGVCCIRIHYRTPRRYAVGFKWTLDSHGEHKRIAIRSGSGGYIFVVVVVIKGESEGLWAILEYPLHAVHSGCAFIFSHCEVSDTFLSCQHAHANGVRSGLVTTRANGDGIGSGSWKLHGASRFTRSPEQCASLQRLPCIL